MPAWYQTAVPVAIEQLALLAAVPLRDDHGRPDGFLLASTALSFGRRRPFSGVRPALPLAALGRRLEQAGIQPQAG